MKLESDSGVEFIRWVHPLIFEHKRANLIVGTIFNMSDHEIRTWLKFSGGSPSKC